MPIYEYRCKKCENRFEKMRPMSQAHHPAICPECQSDQTMRLLSLFASQNGESGEACDSSQASGTPCCRVIGGG
ncbi:MAG: zinc ribbon domain-containing protein [Armatimonadaceae bacterium]